MLFLQNPPLNEPELLDVDADVWVPVTFCYKRGLIKANFSFLSNYVRGKIQASCTHSFKAAYPKIKIKDFFDTYTSKIKISSE